jgi:hypothetical protein
MALRARLDACPDTKLVVIDTCGRVTPSAAKEGGTAYQADVDALVPPGVGR